MEFTVFQRTYWFLQRAYWDITGDWSKTFRLVLAPWLLIKICVASLNFFFLGSVTDSLSDSTTLPPDSPYYVIASVFLLLEIGVGIWIAVAWHRYVLLKEHPSGYLPKWVGALNFWYFVKLILVSVISVVPLIASAILSTHVLSSFTGTSATLGTIQLARWAIMSPGVLLFNYLLLRIGILLPAVATQRQMRIGEAWRLTRTFRVECFGASIVLFITYAALLGINLLFHSFQATQIATIVATGLASFLSLSLLTVLYDKATS